MINHRLLTTKRIRSIVKTATARHDVEIESSKTRQVPPYSGMIHTYGRNVRVLNFSLKAADRKNLTGFLDEINTVFALSGGMTVNHPYIYMNNTMRITISALLENK
jgi:hypothetical protein